MLYRSRLRRGISLEVIFEEECLRSTRPGELLSRRSRSPQRLPHRAPSLMTLAEHEIVETGGGGGGCCWEDDEFHNGAGGISRRQILDMTRLYGPGAEDIAPPVPPRPASPGNLGSSGGGGGGGGGGEAATRRWVAAHSSGRRPRTVGDLRARHRGTEILGQYRLADLLVNDNIVIVDTTPPPVPKRSGAAEGSKDGTESSAGDGAGDGAQGEGAAGGEMPQPQTVRRVADRFEQLAKAEPDSYVMWRDTTRLCGIRANPSSKILRSDPASGERADACHRLFQQELHELFRARRAAADGTSTLAGGDADSGAEAGSETAGSDGADHPPPESCCSDSDSDYSDSLLSSSPWSAGGGGGGGVRPVSAEALARIRRQGVSVTYHGPRGGRPSLGQLVAEARRQPAFVAAVAAPRVVGAVPKRGSHTLPHTPRSRDRQPAAATEAAAEAAAVAAAVTLRPRRTPAEPTDWRQTARCYVFDFSQSRGHQPPPVQLKPRPEQV